MKIRLLTPQHLLVPEGTLIDVEDSRAALLIAIGAAERTVKPAKVETAVAELAAETPEKPKRTRKKA